MCGAVPARRILHAGCGRTPLPEFLHGIETRLDVDPQVQPDVCASMTEMGDIGPFDTIWCSHSLEHLRPAEAEQALAEFHRVLAVGGFAMIMVPDLQGVALTDEVLYLSPAGPITGRHLYYGHDRTDNPHMLHKNGFIADTLRAALLQHFSRVEVRRLENYNLFGVGVK